MMLSSFAPLCQRFMRLLRPVFRANVRGRLFALLLVVLVLKVAIVGVNVLNSFVNRFFINALIEREFSEFLHYALIYLAAFVFLSILGSLAVYAEEMLGVRWREWLTEFFFNGYLSERRYYRIERSGGVDNPDQRISEDIRTYTTVTLSLLLIVFDATVSLASFIAVLWTITPWLVLAAVCYAAVGSVLTLFVGAPLVSLNQLQLQKEADFRFSLSRLREHAEGIALLGGESGERRRLTRRLDRVIDNSYRVIKVNRNLRYFVAFYGYLNPLLPVLVVSPFFLSGYLTDFGAITQSAMAFPFVLGAFSVLVNQFGQISTLAAAVNRLGALWETMRAAKSRSCVESVLSTNEVRAEDVSILANEGAEVLIKELSLYLPHGGRLLVAGPQGVGKTSLFRAFAGLECRGSGCLVRPADAMFLPQRPYAPMGTFRHLLTYTAADRDVSDDALRAALRAVSFAPFLTGRLHLDDEQPWTDLLSIGEQQQIGLARLLIAPPTFAFLDDALSALSDTDAMRLYGLLDRIGIGYMSFSEHLLLAPHHDQILELTGKGSWRLRDRTTE
jgi:putative ATP-binding cassette transporter